MWQLAGALLLVSLFLGVVVFHFGWRNRHPGTGWPARAIVSFGGGIASAIGLMLGSWLLGIAGVALYIMARLLPLSPSA